MILQSNEFEGLTLWLFLFGTTPTDFEVLHKAGLTAYFMFSNAVHKGILNREFDPKSSKSMFTLTELGVSIIKGEQHGSR